VNDHGRLIIAAAALATIVGVAGPVPELGFILQISGLGALVGTAIAHRPGRALAHEAPPAAPLTTN
jgi:hypothetical protein